MKNNKGKKIALIILSIVLLILIIAFIIVYNTVSYVPSGIINATEDDFIKDLPEILPDNMKTELRAVVVKVDENYLGVKANNGNLYYANYAKNGQFKTGQEITIFYDGEKILNTNPAVLLDVGNINTEKEVSDIVISEDDLRIFREYRKSCVNKSFRDKI